ncbi:aminotransferase class I/II-fold pyridoxal phosphate-dependent enzyme, partial [Streptomyces sp. NPDC003860]
ALGDRTDDRDPGLACSLGRERGRGALAGLRPLTRRTPPYTLPPSPLAPRHHWVVNESAREVEGPEVPPGEPYGTALAPTPTGHEQPPPASLPAPPRAACIVFEEVSRTGVFPRSDLGEGMKLSADLGFDSLMLQELETNISKRVPGFQSEELYAPDLTVAGLIGLVAPGRALPAADTPAPPVEPQEPAWQESAAHEPAVPWRAETASVDDFPEVGQFERRLGSIVDSGADFPYFRVHEGNIRSTTVIAGRPYLSFGSYNYLGLSGHPKVNDAVHQAIDRYGSSVSASRVLSGERDLTVRLERALADFLGVGDCLTLVSGHATNVTAIGHLVGDGDLVVHDALAHDSILQGCALSGAARRPFAHNDVDQLEHVLRRNRSRFRRVLIAVEGAYSMDGDLVDLPAVIELKKRFGALLLVDEAHSIGTVGQHGRGVGEFFGVDRGDVDLWMGTLSKAFASCGGYLGGSAR